MAEPIVKLENVHFQYESKTVLEDVNFVIPRGAFMGLIGPNGGGKTTLIKLILGLLKPQQGSVELFQTPIRKFKEKNKIGFVSQKANSFNRGFPATVREVVSMGLTSKIGYFKFLTKEHHELIEKAVAQVDMSDYLHENIGDLSGGQQQRVFIARALVNNPELLILDEPTVGVDQEHVQHFYHMLHTLNQDHQITLLLVTHDTGTMTDYVTDLVCLNKRLHFHGNVSEYANLSNKDLSEMYGHSLHIVDHNHS
ncbi:metal ABC transporter ATP-binding protein [Radiobacillus kanasensis]|uniref:metal ABC transporter ATP-binding protein n=1 Tax=Radiobacillus kanasensis TaxID=2844358 RepID=UPI001E39695C|nr:metal ABC transporter ATP-binding protein [Radiobacillus kanasensis]UFT98263.1 metal ABC transporter ATP-binding protein [Radiobacillus kanasensis]